MLILASASPARKALLHRAGFRFRVAAARVRELKGRGRGLAETVLENARRKAAAVSRVYPTEWVLAADTLIEFEGRIYGKPSDRHDGVRLLHRMGGKTHLLATGLVLRRGGRVIERVVRTRVTLRARDRSAVHRHATAPERFAGGYAIRRGRDPIVARIQGSFTNVVGLPMEVVAPLLERVLPS